MVKHFLASRIYSSQYCQNFDSWNKYKNWASEYNSLRCPCKAIFPVKFPSPTPRKLVTGAMTSQTDLIMTIFIGGRQKASAILKTCWACRDFQCKNLIVCDKMAAVSHFTKRRQKTNLEIIRQLIAIDSNRACGCNTTKQPQLDHFLAYFTESTPIYLLNQKYQECYGQQTLTTCSIFKTVLFLTGTKCFYARLWKQSKKIWTEKLEKKIFFQDNVQTVTKLIKLMSFSIVLLEKLQATHRIKK